jgi:hypothetical protein
MNPVEAMANKVADEELRWRESPKSSRNAMV